MREMKIWEADEICEPNIQACDVGDDLQFVWAKQTEDGRRLIQMSWLGFGKNEFFTYRIVPPDEAITANFALFGVCYSDTGVLLWRVYRAPWNPNLKSWKKAA